MADCEHCRFKGEKRKYETHYDKEVLVDQNDWCTELNMNIEIYTEEDIKKMLEWDCGKFKEWQ